MDTDKKGYVTHAQLAAAIKKKMASQGDVDDSDVKEKVDNIIHGSSSPTGVLLFKDFAEKYIESELGEGVLAPEQSRVDKVTKEIVKLLPQGIDEGLIPGLLAQWKTLDPQSTGFVTVAQLTANVRQRMSSYDDDDIKAKVDGIIANTKSVGKGGVRFIDYAAYYFDREDVTVDLSALRLKD